MAGVLCCGAKQLTYQNPRVMGILNVTPDSFSDGGRLYSVRDGVDLSAVLAHADAAIEQGADILDVGGESTRPGAQSVSVEGELARVIPVVEALAGRATIVSVDTRHWQVAEAAVAAGADMINDVSGGRDPRMLQTIAASNVGYVLMHMQGEPQTMQKAPHYHDVVAEVRGFLDTQVHACVAAGISADRIAIDPGFGFGKSQAHNLCLLAGLSALADLGCPIVAGLSRKSLLGAITGRAVDERLASSVAAAMLAVGEGAAIVRVHDVGATVDALKVMHAVRDAQAEGGGQQ